MTYFAISIQFIILISKFDQIYMKGRYITDENACNYKSTSIKSKIDHSAVCYTAAGSVNSYKRVDIWPSNFPFHSCTSHFVATITHIVSNQKVIRNFNKKNNYWSRLWNLSRTTDAQRGNSLQCMAKNSIPIPILGTAKAYFVCHMGPIFQISWIGCL